MFYLAVAYSQKRSVAHRVKVLNEVPAINTCTERVNSLKRKSEEIMPALT
jgi:hypothetical protein